MSLRARVLTRGVTLAVAAVLLGFAIAQAPHTVHHLFEAGGPDGGGDAVHDCAFASAADRAQAAFPPTGLTATIAEAPYGILPPPTVAPPAQARTAFPARAPPASAA